MASREVRRQPPARGRRSEIRVQKKVIRDKSPAIPVTDGATDITGLQSQLLLQLTICIASMADHRNVDIPSGVIDAINDPIVSDSNFSKDSCDPEV